MANYSSIPLKFLSYLSLIKDKFPNTTHFSTEKRKGTLQNGPPKK